MVFVLSLAAGYTNKEIKQILCKVYTSWEKNIPIFSGLDYTCLTRY